MFGIEQEDRLPESVYAPKVSDKVYAMMSERTERPLIDGCPEIVDVVFDKASRRAAIETAAQKADAFFNGNGLQADADQLKHTVETRR